MIMKFSALYVERIFDQGGSWRSVRTSEEQLSWFVREVMPAFAGRR